jgi:hypothetical protein
MGRMGEWENGRMGEWENGRMGEWENRRMGEWENWRMGELENWRIGEWENGRMGEYLALSSLRLVRTACKAGLPPPRYPPLAQFINALPFAPDKDGT